MLRRRSLMGGGPKDYIEFANADIGAYFAERYGDGVGITYAQAAAITEFDSSLRIRDIVGQTSYTFEELNYFTGLVSLPAYFLESYKRQETYDCHISCLSLPNLTSVGAECFMFSTLLELDCPKLVDVGSDALCDSKTKRIIFGDDFTTYTGNGMINWNDDLEYLYFSNLQAINGYYICSVCNNVNLKVYIATPSGIPTIDSEIGTSQIFRVSGEAKLYVPSNLVSAYEAAGNPWALFKSINAI